MQNIKNDIRDETRDWDFLKDYAFFFFLLKNIDKDIGKKISQNLSEKYTQSLLNHAEKFATDAIKAASKK